MKRILKGVIGGQERETCLKISRFVITIFFCCSFPPSYNVNSPPFGTQLVSSPQESEPPLTQSVEIPHSPRLQSFLPYTAWQYEYLALKPLNYQQLFWWETGRSCQGSRQLPSAQRVPESDPQPDIHLYPTWPGSVLKIIRKVNPKFRVLPDILGIPTHYWVS